MLSKEVGARYYVAIDAGTRSRKACRARLNAGGYSEGDSQDFRILSPPLELAELAVNLGNSLQPSHDHEPKSNKTGDVLDLQRLSDKVCMGP